MENFEIGFFENMVLTVVETTRTSTRTTCRPMRDSERNVITKTNTSTDP